METKDILEKSEEVVEAAAVDLTKANGNANLKYAAIFGIGCLAGIAICKVAKPVIAKIKDKRAERKAEKTVVADVEFEEQDME